MHNATVEAVRAELQAGDQFGESDRLNFRIGDDGKEYSIRKPKPPNPDSTSAKLTGLVAEAGSSGLTVAEARQQMPDTDPHTVATTLNSLAQSGAVVPSGEKRKDPERGGRPAIAYVAGIYQPSVPAPIDEDEKTIERIVKLARELKPGNRQRLMQRLAELNGAQ